MQGHERRYQNGFDCQGLWVEVNVDMTWVFKSKLDIEDYGLASVSSGRSALRLPPCKPRIHPPGLLNALNDPELQITGRLTDVVS